MIRTYFVFFVLIDHILNLLCLLLSVQGSYKLFLIVRKNDSTVLIKYQKYSPFRGKKTKIKICPSVSSIHNYTIKVLIFFSLFTYLHDKLQE